MAKVRPQRANRRPTTGHFLTSPRHNGHRNVHRQHFITTRPTHPRPNKRNRRPNGHNNRSRRRRADRRRQNTTRIIGTMVSPANTNARRTRARAPTATRDLAQTRFARANVRGASHRRHRQPSVMQHRHRNDRYANRRNRRVAKPTKANRAIRFGP